MKWYDSRLKSPPCNHADIYSVIFMISGFAIAGYATWMPTEQYTNGYWTDVMCTNSNPQSDGIVLYWVDHPTKPEGIEL